MTASRTYRFESKCIDCQGRITSNDSGHTWRHDHRPAKRHLAHPVGEYREI